MISMNQIKRILHNDGCNKKQKLHNLTENQTIISYTMSNELKINNYPDCFLLFGKNIYFCIKSTKLKGLKNH